MSEEQNLDEDEKDTEDEKSNRFPAANPAK